MRPASETVELFLSAPSGPTGTAVDGAGASQDEVQAIEGRWVFHAEVAARECGNLTLAEALELACLYAEAEPAKFEKAALRWHGRFVAEVATSLLSAQIALAALSELRAGSGQAKSVLFGFLSPD
jgi:hypothetical protein